MKSKQRKPIVREWQQCLHLFLKTKQYAHVFFNTLQKDALKIVWHAYFKQGVFLKKCNVTTLKHQFFVKLMWKIKFCIIKFGLSKGLNI